MKREFITRTLQVWQEISPALLNEEDAEEIIHHMKGFLEVLGEWEAKRMEAPQRKASDVPPPPVPCRPFSH